MVNLFKKAFVLLVLFLLVLVVYLMKNPDIKDGLLAKVNIFKSEDFKILEDIKIQEEDINMSELVFEENAGSLAQETEAEEETEKSDYFIVSKTESEEFHKEQEEKDFLVVAAQNNSKISLEDIEDQVAKISEQIQEIEKEIEILIAINKIQEEINELAEKAGNLNSECQECNILSSI